MSYDTLPRVFSNESPFSPSAATPAAWALPLRDAVIAGVDCHLYESMSQS